MSVRARFNARKLDQWVRFDRKVETKATNGDIAVSWAPKVSCWAAIDGAKAFGAEPYVTDGIRSVSDLTVWIRADIFTCNRLVLTDRMFWQGQPYDIKDIPNQQLRGRFIALFVTAGVNLG